LQSRLVPMPKDVGSVGTARDDAVLDAEYAVT
jgi:hypothetical protein